MSIQPVGDRVLLALMPEIGEEKTEGGILVPNVVEGAPKNEGVVLAIGDDDSILVKIDDKVIFDHYAGVKVTEKVEGVVLNCLVVRADDIIAVIED